MSDKNEFETLFRYMREIKRNIDSVVDKELAEKNTGLRFIHGKYLFAVNDNEGIGLSDLTKKICVNKSNTTRVIGELIEMNYVRKETDGNDSRKFRLYITEEGRRIHAVVFSVLEKIKDNAFKNFTNEDISQFNDFFENLIENIKQS